MRYDGSGARSTFMSISLDLDHIYICIYNVFESFNSHQINSLALSSLLKFELKL